jgi:hypothetical protein
MLHKRKIYFERIASTGSSLDAETAGAIPAMSPMREEIKIPKLIFFMLKETSMSKEAPMAIVIRNMMSNPIIPPVMESNIDSNKN